MQQLHDIINNYNPKNYISMIKRKPDLLSFLEQYQNKVKANSLIEALYCFKTNQDPIKCPCGKNALFNTFNKGYRQFCSISCDSKGKLHAEFVRNLWQDSEKLKSMQEKRTKTLIEKYGVDNPVKNPIIQEKIKKTCEEKYGASSPLASKIIQEKIQQKNLEKYGHHYPLSNKKIQNLARENFLKNNPDLPDLMWLARQAFMEKNQGLNPFQVPDIIERKKKTMLEKYGVPHAKQQHLTEEQLNILNNEEKFIENIKDLTLSEAGERLGVDIATIARKCIKYNCRQVLSQATRSRWEFKMTNFLKELGLIEGTDFIRNERLILDKKELDFYFPNHKFAIELGAIFWHSEISSGRGRYYHYDKWNLCKNNEITLLQYWDNEMTANWPAIESKIKYLLNKIDRKIGARKINKIDLIERDQEIEFLNKNHIQGFTKDRSWAYGAWHDHKLVAILCLARRGKQFEIVRYANNLDSNYPGLFSRMVKHVSKHLNFEPGTEIFSYSDNRHGSGGLYSSSGFTKVKDIRVTQKYTKDYHKLFNSKGFTKQRLAKRFGIDVTQKTELELTAELGYDRIWDCGKIKWVKVF
jgi:hypothetical protein